MKTILIILNTIFGILWIAKGFAFNDAGSIALGTISLIMSAILYVIIDAERRL